MLTGHLNAFLLGKHLKLLSMRSHKGGFLWEVEKHPSEPACIKCGSVKTVRAGRITTTVREEPIRTVALWLKIKKHRIYCKDCKKTFAEPVPGIWPRRRSTQRFRKAVAQACGKMTDLATVSRFHSVSHGFAYQIYYEQVEIKLREQTLQQRWPEVLGIDEHFFRRQKGVTEFVTMFTDIDKKKMFEMAHGKYGSSLIEQMKDIPGRERVKFASLEIR